jgi:hypothetical protein
MADIDIQVLPLAQRQHGVFTVFQVRAGGGTVHQIKHRVEDGLWERRSRHVLALAGAPRTFEHQIMAACLHTDGSVASHRSAARLQRVPNLRTTEVEVTACYGDTSRNPFGTLHRSVDLTSEDIVLVGAIPTTSLPRTVADLFTCLSLQRASWIAEGLLATDRLTLDALAAVHDRYGRQGRPATVDVRELIARLDEVPPLQSELEQRARSLLVDAGLPDPVRQVPLPGWVEHPAHADFAYPAARLIIEVDGRSWHTRTQDFEVDRRRDNAAQVAGWVVLRFTWRQVVDDPDYVVATIRAALRRAA